MTLTPANGRDYKSAKAAIADFNEGKDFILNDITSRWDGKPVNKEDIMRINERSVQIRYNKLRNITVVIL